MGKVIKVIVKNVIEFEVDDDLVLSSYDRQNFIVLARKAVMQVPHSALVNDAKYKIKEK